MKNKEHEIAVIDQVYNDDKFKKILLKKNLYMMTWLFFFNEFQEKINFKNYLNFYPKR